MFQMNNIRIPELEDWNLTLGPAAGYVAGPALRGPALGAGIACNKLGFSLQFDITALLARESSTAFADNSGALSLHAGIGAVFFSGGYSRMWLLSGKAVNGWHLCLDIPLPVFRKYHGVDLKKFCKLYYRPSWLYFQGRREVFHEIGIAIRWRFMLE